MDVRYEISLVTYLDILGFKDLIATRTTAEISRILGAVKDAVELSTHDMHFKKPAYRIPQDQYQSFSDLSLIVGPIEGVELFPPCLQPCDQLLHIVRAQAHLVIDEGILIRGAVTIGKVVKSMGMLVGPAVVRAYELERDFALYPRIIIDNRVFEALNGLPADHERTNMRDLVHLTRRDADRIRFVDYLRAVQSELDDPAYYHVCLDRHNEFILQGSQRYSRNCGVRPKYE